MLEGNSIKTMFFYFLYFDYTIGYTYICGLEFKYFTDCQYFNSQKHIKKNCSYCLLGFQYNHVDLSFTRTLLYVRYFDDH